MDSMLKPKLPDDPHDIIVVAPDAVRVAPADGEIADPIRDLMQRAPSEPHSHAGSDFTAEAAVPPVDATFRATAVNAGSDLRAGRSADRFCAPAARCC